MPISQDDNMSIPSQFVWVLQYCEYDFCDFIQVLFNYYRPTISGTRTILNNSSFLFIVNSF